MQEMIEPDRTILIVSVVGLIVIWGSVAYHKFVQDSAPAVEDGDEFGDVTPPVDPPEEAPKEQAASGPSGKKGRGKGKKGGRKKS